MTGKRTTAGEQKEGIVPKNSIRTKITMLTVSAIVIAMTMATLVGSLAIRNLGNSDSNQLLLLLCETGQKNLDYYFSSVENSVELVSTYAEEDLEGLSTLDAKAFQDHVDRVSAIFDKTARSTNGAITYYYRIDPEVSDTVEGFWYTDLDGEGYKEHQVTDITLYDTSDTSNLVWFTVPKDKDEPVWQSPYVTDNLDVRVISYNVPIYWHGEFVGVVGMEIDYSVMAEQVDSITLYENGYAFINDAEGNLVYHPYIDVSSLDAKSVPKVPEGLMDEETLVRYTFEGVNKRAVHLPLVNGMLLNVSVPVDEINGNWVELVYGILAVSIALLVAFVVLTMRLASHITKPLEEITKVAEQVNVGNYDVQLEYDADDEIGILARTFNQLIRNLKAYVSDLNSLAYADALTSVRNKGAYDIFVHELDERLDDAGGELEFAVAVFDCNDLKMINDQYGHDKGNVYLKTACKLICDVFKHSPVFRVGGDEFVVVMQKDDCKDRSELARLFVEQGAVINNSAGMQWKQVHVAMGIAAYDSQVDKSVDDVMRRADKLMYEDKRAQKAARSQRLSGSSQIL